MRRLIAVALLAAFVAAGCQRPAARPAEYQTVGEDARRDTKTARQENAKAFEFIEMDELEKAEKALKAALTADPFFGPAHNNLGIVFHRQGRHYQAAWEFQYALKLMPYSPEPRSNLGLVYEAVGRLDEAEKWYGEALTIQPDNPELIGNLARTLAREGRKDARMQQLLQDLVLKDTRPDWVAWARERLALMHVEAPPTEIKPAPKGEQPPPAPASKPTAPGR
jgi:Tfp pilus assembly protein PilF